MIQRLFGNDFENTVKDALNDTEPAGLKYSLKNIPPELIPLYAAAIKRVSGRNLIWITGENENTDILKYHLDTWNKFLGDSDTEIHVHRLPWEDPYINNTISPETAGEKNRLLASVKDNQLRDNDKNNNTHNNNIAVITTFAALSIKLERKKDADSLILTLKANDETTPNELINTLSELGYNETKKVEEAGEYSFHHTILEIFPAGFDYPYRIKFSDKGIDSIKRFHPVSRISIEPVLSIDITTTVYFEKTKSKNTDILYLTELLEDYIIVSGDTESLKHEYGKLLANFDAMRKHHRDDVTWTPISEIFTFPVDTLTVFNLAPPTDGDSPTPIMPDKHTVLNLTAETVEQWQAEGCRVTFCCGTGQKEQTTVDTFGKREMIKGDIPVSLYFPQRNEYFIAYPDRWSGDNGGDIQQLNRHLFDGIETGDLVVHKKHGIGRFSGFKHLDMEGETAEFLTITYQDDARIYVPVHELDLLSKYMGFEGHEPPLDKIGGATWEVKKKEAQKNIVTFARELLDLYAKRKALTGHSFKIQPEVENAFTRDFSFVETRDQKAAIRDVLADLEAPCPMDRLICGDVSFGKTEIALRAAIRVAAAGKQTVVLCPTTVLAHQHYTTFKKRFASLPYSIEYLSRRVSPADRKGILHRLAAGDIDIIIGTHALLGKAVDFKDPGLFIIDEEQRFGVFQKEKLVKGREHVDILSLSATPIPRTLSFAIAGLRDVSVINTPPVGRKAVKNYIGPFSEELLVSAVAKERDRKGQTFIVYNNIEGIYGFRDKLQELMPEVTFSLIHARMEAEEIEDVVFGFIDREADVLVSTTIIENGIDIPNVNTMVVVDAQNFGLTQLYQLRGRIGRGTQQGYAYFFHGNHPGSGGGEVKLTERADKRLEAIREFSHLGSGYKVAEFDLKMRGAGTLLGNRQHGHVEALGYDYFLGLLKKTIAQLRGEDVEVSETVFAVQFTYSISGEYIGDVQERIGVYKGILEAGSVVELSGIREQLEDRYGEVEEGLLRGFLVANVRVLARYFGFAEVEMSRDMMTIVLGPIYDDKKETFEEFMELFDGRVTDPTEVIIEYPELLEFIETLQIFLLELE